MGKNKASGFLPQFNKHLNCIKQIQQVLVYIFLSLISRFWLQSNLKQVQRASWLGEAQASFELEPLDHLKSLCGIFQAKWERKVLPVFWNCLFLHEIIWNLLTECHLFCCFFPKRNQTIQIVNQHLIKFFACLALNCSVFEIWLFEKCIKFSKYHEVWGGELAWPLLKIIPKTFLGSF